MGYYTDVNCSIKLKKDTPDNLIKFFNARLTRNNVMPSEYDIEHSFFVLPRWWMLLSRNNNPDFFIYDGHHWIINIKANFKMYSNEIGHFVNWLNPYILGSKNKEYLGFTQGEDNHDRKNIYVDRETSLREQTIILYKEYNQESIKT